MTILLAMLAAAAAAQSAEPSMRADDPAAFHAGLVAMGYSPAKLDLSAAPATTVTVSGDEYWVVLGGCDDRKKGCKTVMVGGRFTDVKSAPLEWINKQNLSFDLLKAWRNEEGELAYSVQAPTGGMTRPNFRALVDGLVAAEGVLAKEASDAKLVKE